MVASRWGGGAGGMTQGWEGGAGKCRKERDVVVMIWKGSSGLNDGW